MSRKKDGSVTVNVWPTVKKYMRVGLSSANKYTDVTRVVSEIFEKDPSAPSAERKKASEEVGALQAGGLDYIKQKHGTHL